MVSFPFNFLIRNFLPWDCPCWWFFFPVAEIDGNTYWRHPFNSLFHPKQLEEFIIMDINRVQDKKKGAGAGARSNKVRVPQCFGPSSPLPPLISWTSVLNHSTLQSQMYAFLCLAIGKKLFSGWCGQCFGLEIAQALHEFHFQKCFSGEEFKLYLLLSLLKLFYISFATLQLLNWFCWSIEAFLFNQNEWVGTKHFLLSQKLYVVESYEIN